jgi:hypothetical protein
MRLPDTTIRSLEAHHLGEVHGHGALLGDQTAPFGQSRLSSGRALPVAPSLKQLMMDQQGALEAGEGLALASVLT